jgi:AcrR family transcriptional regulator
MTGTVETQGMAGEGEPGEGGAEGGRGRTPKGEQTRAQILETALGLFRDRGYEETTMRAIASTAGVAMGNAYYYFPSKEHIVQVLYRRSHEEHRAVYASLLEGEKEFKQRLLVVMRAKVDTLMPYHRFAGVLFKTAADPASPLNPFSQPSEALRRDAVAVFEEVVEGSRLKVDKALRAELPRLLWLYHMGVILFWIHDSSPGCESTYKLVNGSVDLLARLLALSRLPVARGFVRSVLRLTAELGAPAAGS